MNDDDQPVSTREFTARIAEIQRAVDVAATAARESAGDKVDLRHHFERILTEHARALDMAEHEREKAALALREQQQRAMDKADAEREKSAATLREAQQRAEAVAASEREKAAAALRHELARAIEEGDERLLVHIVHQREQVQADLASAEKLEIERIKAAENHTRSVSREVELIQRASKEAIEKAEASTKEQFKSVNEFRAQLTDQTAQFLPREVADAQFAELRRSIADIAEKVGKLI